MLPNATVRRPGRMRQVIVVIAQDEVAATGHGPSLRLGKADAASLKTTFGLRSGGRARTRRPTAGCPR
jgi:hypothetical protein